jgi:hypothetical protein
MQTDHDERIPAPGRNMGCAVAFKQKLMHAMQFVIASRAGEQKTRMIGQEF